MSLLIKNGFIVSRNHAADIFIERDTITRIGSGIAEKADRVIDASGLHVFLGFLDMHCHLREPGFIQKEDVLSGSRAAAAGGFTQICPMPNTNPPTDSIELIRFILERQASVKVSPVACITKGQQGRELTDFATLTRAGAVGFSDDGLPVLSPYVMRRAMLQAKPLGALLMLHEEDMDIRGNGAVNEGENARTMGIPGIPARAEEAMIERDIGLSRETLCLIHICHVSTAGSVELIRRAKREGAPVTCETAPHYFSLDDSAILSGDTNTKVNPPIRSAADVAAIKQGIADGTIDAIATDHAPHTAEDKAGGFEKAAFGLIGFETAFSLGYMHLVEPGIISLARLEELMSANPRRILGLGGALAEGEAADIALCNLNETYIYTKDSVVSRSKNSPFINKELKGKAVCTIVNGEVKYDRQAD